MAVALAMLVAASRRGPTSRRRVRSRRRSTTMSVGPGPRRAASKIVNVIDSFLAVSAGWLSESDGSAHRAAAPKLMGGWDRGSRPACRGSMRRAMCSRDMIAVFGNTRSNARQRAEERSRSRRRCRSGRGATTPDDRRGGVRRRFSGMSRTRWLPALDGGASCLAHAFP